MSAGGPYGILVSRMENHRRSRLLDTRISMEGLSVLSNWAIPVVALFAEKIGKNPVSIGGANQPTYRERPCVSHTRRLVYCRSCQSAHKRPCCFPARAHPPRAYHARRKRSRRFAEAASLY